MSTPDAGERLAAQPNPYTDAAPLRARDHPWRQNRPLVVVAALVAAAPLLWVAGRWLAGTRPVLEGEVLTALLVGLPLAAVIAAFPVLLSSRARVVLGATTLTRSLRPGRGETRTIRLADVRAGIYASRVRYRRELGRELVLFLGGGRILWIADGIEPADVTRIAAALSGYGVREYDRPVTNEQLAALVQKARRADGRGATD